MTAGRGRVPLRQLSLALVALAASACDGPGLREPLQEGFVNGIYVLRGRPSATPGHLPPGTQRPGVRQTAPGRYEVLVHAYNWGLDPVEIRVPRDAAITFRALSLESNHGFAIVRTGIVLSLWRNRVAEATHTFTEPGEYPFVCSEYCGGGHDAMVGRLIVE